VQKIVEIPGWINVMDPTFNLHLKLDAISESWMVVKPTVDGPVHSLEVFDSHGNLVVQFFGKRKPGQPELPGWIDLITGLQ
jgi:putative hemin transport protein